ncbi:MAG: hypothetical protein GY772_30595 [bacterium]|nr:hypothetical protein [bacterium]
MDIAQLAHTHCLLDAGALYDEQWLSFGWPPPSGPIWQGAYCDDYVLLGLCRGPPGGLCDPARREVFAIRARTQVGYARYGYEEKSEKEVIDASAGVAWGGELSTSRRDVGGEIKKQLQLVGVTRRLLCARRASPRMVAQLAGARTHHLCFRRPALCLLDQAFAFSRRPGRPPNRIVELPRVVCQEFLLLAIIFPLFRA